MSRLHPRKYFAQQDQLRARHVPAPVAGMNLVDPASGLGPLDAISTVNLVKGERGLLPRPGWREYATNIGLAPGDVRSLLPHHGGLASNSKLFACAENGIYDVTAGGAAPTLKFTFPATGPASGRGVWSGAVTGAGAFLLYADEQNGYHVYTESTDTWAAGVVAGVSPTSLVFVTVFKNRVWFVERDSMRAWYLAAGPALSGAATQFDLQSVFQNGGSLVGMWSWSLDSGSGRDDYLIFVSSTGEVAMYTGTDPATNFALKGLWNLQGVPAGRRLAFAYGNDLLFLTTQGVLPISVLTREGSAQDQLYATRAVQPLFVQTMAAQANMAGWEMNMNPKAGFMFVNTPGIPGGLQEQYAMSYSSRGWSRLQGLDILSTAVWQGDLYFGTRDGRVCQSNGYVDNVKLGGDTTDARSVNCFTIGGFTNLGSMNYKTLVSITPRFITRGVTPVQETLARFDFDIADAGAAAGASSGAGALWGSAVWGTALWGGGYVPAAVVQSAVGRGVHMAIGVAFQAQDYALLVGCDVAWQEEGLY